mmetsp:Transcript_114769/g.319670  ORF Transcript_114769/g.319670 Transcript_114769/m.319670 type:complete len:203 (+) Transcript_114769:494-1102(+)
MYGGFPRMPVSRHRPPATAISKSMRTTSPSGRRSVFSSEMSQCATPRSCSRCTARKSERITGQACCSRSGPGRLRLQVKSKRSPPGIYSVTRRTSPRSSRKAPWQAQTPSGRPPCPRPRRCVSSTSGHASSRPRLPAPLSARSPRSLSSGGKRLATTVWPLRPSVYSSIGRVACFASGSTRWSVKRRGSHRWRQGASATPSG